MNPLVNNGADLSLIGKFMEFQKKMQGQNPEKIINEMLNSGQITKAQLNDAVEKARELIKFISTR